jgi:hypothetical protein
MIKNIIFSIFISIMFFYKTYALPIGFLILWWESFIFIWATLSSIFFTIFFYFKKMSILNKFITFFAISLLLSTLYFWVTEYYYNTSEEQNTSIDSILP